MRKEGVVLEDDPHPPLLRLLPEDALAPDQDISNVGSLEAGDQTQQGRLAAARWADERQEFPLTDGQRDAGHRVHLSKALM